MARLHLQSNQAKAEAQQLELEVCALRDQLRSAEIKAADAGKRERSLSEREAALAKEQRSFATQMEAERAQTAAELSQDWHHMLQRNKPKGPCRTKDTTKNSNFTMRSKFTTAKVIYYGDPPPELTQFSCVLQAFLPSKRGSRRSKYMGGGG